MLKHRAMTNESIIVMSFFIKSPFPKNYQRTAKASYLVLYYFKDETAR